MDFELAKANLEDLVRWAEENAHGDERNEATTRLHLIDRLFFECLGWERQECVAEEAFDGSYVDYRFGRIAKRLIVEAKREGTYFELPIGFERRTCKIETLFATPAIKDAITQAVRYCMERGIPLGAVCNGRQIIAFIGSRQDGVPPLQGNALVFSSLDSMLKDFSTLWDALSKPGIEAGRLTGLVAPGSVTPPPERLADHLVNYPGFQARNVLQTDLQIMGDLFVQDVVEAGEVEEEFLRSCYASSGALSQYALVSREILKTRYSALFEQDAGVGLSTARTKEGISEELASSIVAGALSRRPVILLGDVGVGKSIFIRHLIKVDAKDELDRALVLTVDFGSEPTYVSDLEEYIPLQFAEQLSTRYDIDIEERNFVRGVYHGELRRFERGIYQDLREADEAAYKKAEIDFLAEKLKNREGHLRACLEHASRGQKRQVVIFLDNVDQRVSEFQERVFLIAVSLAQRWPGTVFVSLRPATFHRSRVSGSLAAYQPRVFTVSPPRVDHVLTKRIAFARNELKRFGRLRAFPEGLTVDSATLDSYLEILERSLQTNHQLVEMLDNLSGGNIRTSLGFLSSFIGSGHVDTEKILSIREESGSYTVPLHEFLRAIIFQDFKHFDPSVSPVANVFDISSPDGKEHFLTPILLTHIHRSGETSEEEGFVPLESVYAFGQGLGFTPSQIGFSLERCLSKGMIEVNPKNGDAEATHCRISTTGAYTVQRLVSMFVYVDAMVVATPIVDPKTRNYLPTVWKIGERLGRCETFVGYLDEQWKAFGEAETLFDWPRVSDELRADMESVRRRVARREQSPNGDS